jgi:ATP-dependent Clp protease ATP-binding subunit ClpC
VFERFTERARQVVVFAQDEARALKHNYIGTEHILLGLLRVEDGLAARVLESFDITVEDARVQVARIVGQGDEVTTGQIPFTPRAKKALEFANHDSLELGHNYIGTEHILLGLVRENEGVAARILLDYDADAEKIRNEMMRRLSRTAGEPERGLAGSMVQVTGVRRPVVLLREHWRSRETSRPIANTKLAHAGLKTSLRRSMVVPPDAKCGASLQQRG